MVEGFRYDELGRPKNRWFAVSVYTRDVPKGGDLTHLNFVFATNPIQAMDRVMEIPGHKRRRFPGSVLPMDKKERWALMLALKEVGLPRHIAEKKGVNGAIRKSGGVVFIEDIMKDKINEMNATAGSVSTQQKLS